MTLAEIRTSARPVSSPWTRVRPLGYRVIPTLFSTFIFLVAILISLSLSLSLSPILPLPSLRKKRENWFSKVGTVLLAKQTNQ